MDESRIEQLARQLGARRAAAVDADVTARAVLRRLREARPPGARWRITLLRAAAALVMLAGGGILVRGVLTDGARVASLPTPPELHELAASELVQVLDSLELQRPVHELVPLGLDGLTESELEQLLRTMEG